MPTNPPNTSNHNLPKVPPLDTEYDNEWGYIINNGEFSDGSDAGTPGLVQALEERVPIVDTDANKFNYTPHSSASFIASDTGEVFVGDGTNWNLVVEDITQFWDSANSELTADVNNTSVSTETMNVSQTGLRVVRSGTQSVDSKTVTKVQFDDVRFDDFGAWDTSNYQYQVPEDGVYFVIGTVQINTLDDGVFMQVYLRINGDAKLQAINQAAANDQFYRTNAATMVQATAGDAIDCAVYHENGTTEDVKGVNAGTHFCIGRVG